MKLHFLGANRQVTGSRCCLEVSRKNAYPYEPLFTETHAAKAIRQRGWDVSVPEYLDVVTLS